MEHKAAPTNAGKAQVNQLQLAQATCGMLRFPNTWTYNGGVFPPFAPTTPTITG